MSDSIVDAFHATTLLKRSDLFDDDRLTPITSIADAATPAPGWVGKDWRFGGTLLVAINPGGGGDTHRLNPTDERLYGLIRRFRDAGAEKQPSALREMSDAWIEIQSTHNIRRVIDAVLEATRSSCAQAAFLNVLPFRTRNDKPTRASELRQAWRKATAGQVQALAPRRIVALGCKAHDALVAAGADKAHEVVLIKRAIGDNRLTPHARETLAALAA